MTIVFTAGPATRGKTPLVMGISGPSGSGKTYSAMMLAQGLAGGKPVFFIDTERGRGLHYADDFAFRHGNLEPPYRPSNYLTAIEAAANAGARCVIVDSWSHAHEGQGGLLEWHDEVAMRMAKGDQSKLPNVTFAAWAEPKADLRRFVARLFTFGCHVIFCMRAKDKIKPVKNERGKMEPQSVGIEPITTDQFQFELGFNLMLQPNSRGAIDFNSPSTKAPGWAAEIMRGHQRLTADMGAALHRWSEGRQAEPAQIDRDALLAEAREKAMEGTASIRAWWEAATPTVRAALQGELDALKTAAAGADAAADNPFSETGRAA